jgi:small-conductance mechanosensitive channel
MWAIATDGIQSVGEGAYDFESTFWVDKENWSSTIRGALRIYIDDYFSSDIYSKCIK